MPVDYQIICLTGPLKGASWPISKQGLVLGRQHDCDIKLADPIASRHHCRISQADAGIIIDDLGARNATLINGRPTRSAILAPGNEIAIGREIFLITSLAEREASSADSAYEFKTNTMDAISPFYDNELISSEIDSRPRTVEELAELFAISRSFSLCGTITTLIQQLRECLRVRFKPLALWIARVHGVDCLSFYDEEGAAPPSCPAPVNDIRNALRAKRSYISNRLRHVEGGKVQAFTMIAPISLGDNPIAVAALYTESPHGAYFESDLRFLCYVTRSLAPFIHAVESIEQLRRDNERLRARAGESVSLVGESRAMAQVREEISQAAKSGLNVLLSGETGTGKELAARMVHIQSARHSGPFMVVNCAATPRDLFESEFFGYVKGAFTGARENHVGLFAQAHSGTLFLDEVGDLSLDNQARILRAIEYGTYRPIGGYKEQHSDIRIVSATNKSLETAVREGSFRSDLFHRLNGFGIRLPSLRSRPSDIPILAHYFVEMGQELAGRPIKGFAPAAMEILASHPWPGNVRELRTCILRAISLAHDSVIQPQDLRIGVEEEVSGPGNPGRMLSMAEVERLHIEDVLRLCQGNIRKASQILKIGRTTLYQKMNKYHIKP